MISQLEYFKTLLNVKKTLPRSKAFTVAIASGKGGVGKSNLAVNLSISAAQQRKGVLLVDGDAGLADLNILLGINPQFHWGHFLDKRMPLSELVVKDIYGIDFLHGFSGITSFNWMNSDAMNRIIKGLNEISAHYHLQIIDVGAGLSETSISFTTTVDLVVLVLNGEITSLADAYGTIKTIRKWNPNQEIQIVVNGVNTRSKAMGVHANLGKVCAQFLGFQPELMGFLPQDKAVPRSVMSQTPVMVGNPHCPYGKSVEEISKIILRRCEEYSRSVYFRKPELKEVSV